MAKQRWKPILLWLQFILPVGYFLFKTATAQAPAPLLRLDPYQKFLSTLKMTGPSLTFFFKRERPLLFLPHSFFEPEVLVTFLVLLLLLVWGSLVKGRYALYLGFFWFLLTLSTLIYQPSFGKIALLEPPYLPSFGLFLILCFLIGKFVSR